MSLGSDQKQASAFPHDLAILCDTVGNSGFPFDELNRCDDWLTKGRPEEKSAQNNHQ